MTGVCHRPAESGFARFRGIRATLLREATLAPPRAGICPLSQHRPELHSPYSGMHFSSLSPSFRLSCVDRAAPPPPLFIVSLSSSVVPNSRAFYFFFFLFLGILRNPHHLHLVSQHKHVLNPITVRHTGCFSPFPVRVSRSRDLFINIITVSLPATAPAHRSIYLERSGNGL